LVSVIESKLSLFEIKMKVGAMDTSVMVEPSLGIGEETLNPVDVGSFANVFLLAVQGLCGAFLERRGHHILGNHRYRRYFLPWYA